MLFFAGLNSLILVNVWAVDIEERVLRAKRFQDVSLQQKQVTFDP